MEYEFSNDCLKQKLSKLRPTKRKNTFLSEIELEKETFKWYIV